MKKILAFEESFKSTTKAHKLNNTLSKKRGEKLKDISDTPRPDKTKVFTDDKINQKYITTASRFHSDATLIGTVLKDIENKEKSSDVRLIDPKTLDIPTVTLTRQQKAHILLRKYYKHNFFLRKLRYKHYLSDLQIQAIFNIVGQIKAAEREGIL